MNAYDEQDVKALTLHLFSMSIAMSSITVEDAVTRVRKALDWLDERGRLRSKDEVDEIGIENDNKSS